MTKHKSSLPLKHILVGLFVFTLFAQAATLTAFAEERRAIKFPGTEGLPFSDGVIAGNTLYVAGQEGTDDQGKLAPGGIARRNSGCPGQHREGRQGSRLRHEGHRFRDRVSG